jgi:hypothetical protein
VPHVRFPPSGEIQLLKAQTTRNALLFFVDLKSGSRQKKSVCEDQRVCQPWNVALGYFEMQPIGLNGPNVFSFFFF